MGYRSEIGLVVRKIHKQAMLSDPDIAQILSEADTRLEFNDGLLFYWDYIKWYCGDTQVAALESFLGNLADYDYLLMKLGENDIDTEIAGEWWENPFDLEYVRHLEFKNPGVFPKQTHVVDLKNLNTRIEAKTCAQCGTLLNNPVPGMPSMKHCPMCEP